MNCRITDRPLKDAFVNLGHAPASNSLLTSEQLLQPESTYPLVCYVHPDNFYVQVEETKSAQSIFNENYVYLSSTSSSMVQHAKEYVDHISKRLGLDAFSRVTEIASNDGYLLQFFKEKGIPCLGVEPSKGAAQHAIKKGIETITEFFNDSFAKTFVDQKGHQNLILGNNVLAHVPDLKSFLKGVKIALAPDGVATFEFPHVLNLITKNQFDTVYHEHFSYFSLFSIQKIVELFGLQLFDVELVSTHGGSYRIYLGHDDFSHNLSDQVSVVLDQEREAGLMDLSTYTGFQQKVDSLKYQILENLISLKKSGARIAGYGAAAKASTTFNYCGIRPDLVEFVCDRAPSKIGKFLPGCHIPIVQEDHLRSTKPDYIIIIPWNLREEISQQLGYARDWGAQFITLVPEVHIF